MDERTLSCLRESEIDTIEIALRKRMEELISEGELEQAEAVENTINSLDKVSVCEEYPGAVGGRRFFETYSEEKSRY